MAFGLFKKSEKKVETPAGPHYHDLTVKEIIAETKDAISIAFQQPATGNIAYKSGQFLTLITTVQGKEVRRAYSLCSSPFVDTDLQLPWLEADAKTIAPIVINRTFRYRCPNGTEQWKRLLEQANIEQTGVFVGNQNEYDDFVQETGFKIDYHPVKDFKELADVIAGADLFMGNQSAAYSIAMGLGKSSVLETIKIKPLQNNECYFPRDNCQYF